VVVAERVVAAECRGWWQQRGCWQQHVEGWWWRRRGFRLRRRNIERGRGYVRGSDSEAAVVGGGRDT